MSEETRADPKRLQRTRTKGWRMPDGAVYVGRPTRWGNPFRVGETQVRSPRVDGGPGWEHEGRLFKTSGAREAFNHSDGSYTWHDVRDATAAECVELYRQYATGGGPMLDWRSDDMTAAVQGLRGKDLVCWCRLDQPCHADVLIEVANKRCATGDEGEPR